MFMRYISILYRFGSYGLRSGLEKDVKLNATDQSILLFIRRHDGINQDGICTYFLLNKTTVTKALDRMEQKGYITRKTNECNKRENHVYLTETGQEAAKTVIAAFSRFEQECLSVLEPEEREKFEEACRKVSEKVLDRQLMQEEGSYA